MSEEGRPLRADARRNRARILEVAVEAFASDGLSVPVQEIARRAGVGTGTVSRHFPTKESLFEAILLIRVGQLADEAARLARSDDPGAAFFEFFSLVIAEGTANLGMAEALAGAGFDFETSAKGGGIDVMGALNNLLARAQRAGAVRADVDAMDVKALISGCLARAPGTADLAARDRMISIARQGLRNALPATGDALQGIAAMGSLSLAYHRLPTKPPPPAHRIPGSDGLVSLDVTDVMRALIIDGPRSARVAEVEAPVPAAGQVVVDVHRVGICGTDFELFTGELAYFAQGKSRFPLRPGHEWCGVVSAVGPGVAEVWHGARVTGDTMLGCGHCRRCCAGNGHVCADRHEIGIMGWPGALADKVLVPAVSLHRLPAAVDDRAGALVEPGGNAQRAASAAQAGPGKRILVWGPGTIGLLTAAFSHAAGAEAHVLGLDSRNRELAAKFGASQYWTADDPPTGTYDAVIDCTGDRAVPSSVLTLVEPAGRVVYIGISPEPSRIDTRDLALNDLTAVGILGASAGLATAVEHYADGRVTPGDLVQVVAGLEGAVEALAGRLSPDPGIKIHIDPRL